MIHRRSAADLYWERSLGPGAGQDGQGNFAEGGPPGLSSASTLYPSKTSKSWACQLKQFKECVLYGPR